MQGAAASRSSRPVMTSPPLVGGGAGHSGVGGAVHVYATGFRASPYADVKPAGDGSGTSRGPADAAARRASCGTPARGARADDRPRAAARPRPVVARRA